MHEDPTRADVRAENARVASPAEEFGEAYEPWIIELGELDEKMGVVVEEQSAERVVATMPVHAPTHQPYGLLHGGASVALAETVASTAAWMNIDQATEMAVGLEINANHLRGKREGMVTATALPVHIGRRTQVWQIEIVDEAGKAVCSSRCTIAVVQRG